MLWRCVLHLQASQLKKLAELCNCVILATNQVTYCLVARLCST